MEFAPLYNQKLFSLDDIERFTDEQGFIGFESYKSIPRTEIEEKIIMEEESYSTDAPTSPLSEESQVSKPSQQDGAKENYSKDCLKFCRKISNLVSEQLSFHSEFTQGVVSFNSKVLESLMGPLSLKLLAPQELDQLQIECLLKLWAGFKDVMSYSKNKKICIVKQEYWEMVFDKKTVTASLREICLELSNSWESVEGRNLLKDSTFLEVFYKILFSSNQMLTLTLIIRDSSNKGTYLRDLQTIESFITMMLSPELFQYYNHRSGKFAKECCGKCKVCRSKNIPENFLQILQNARQRGQLVVSFVNDIFAKNCTNNFEIVVSLMEFALNYI